VLDDVDPSRLTASIDKLMHDIRAGNWSEMLDPDPANYGRSQIFSVRLKDTFDSNGIVYPSVRHLDGECIAAFWPNVIKFIADDRRVALKWDGKRIASWFDFETDEWLPL
jgi:hypothetical protein